MRSAFLFMGSFLAVAMTSFAQMPTTSSKRPTPQLGMFQRESPLKTLLIPPSDPVQSGMSEALNRFIWLRMKGSAGYWRFVAQYEEKVKENANFMQTPRWAYALADATARELLGKGASLVSSVAAPETPWAKTVEKYPELFDPTSQFYREFYGYALLYSRFSNIDEAILSYRKFRQTRNEDAEAQRIAQANQDDMMRRMQEESRKSMEKYRNSQRSFEMQAKRQQRETERRQAAEYNRRMQNGY